MPEPGRAADTGQGEAFPPRPEPPLPIAVSQCLLGSEVRYDGSAAGFAFPHAALDHLLDYRGICPEVGIGFGTPREPIRLVGSAGNLRVLGVNDPGLDVTGRLHAYAVEQTAILDQVVGYVFMRGSPSCGLFDVKVYPRNEGAVTETFTRTGRGAYAAAVVTARPNLPVEENGRLHDPRLREGFLIRAFAYAHWGALERMGITFGRLMDFHSRYGYLLMAHSVPHWERAGRLLAGPGDPAGTGQRYLGLLMAALSRPAGRRGHVHVLRHLRGRLHQRLGESAGRELDALVRAHHHGEVSVAEPIARIRKLLRRHPDRYLERQAYLDLYSGWLMDREIRRQTG